MTARAEFRDQVVNDLRVGLEGRPALGYEEYLDLPEDERSGDEAAFVDMLFVPRVLRWLGYDDASWTYNRTKARGRADFVVHPLGAAAFVIEDANSTKPFAREDVQQLRRYTAGTQGYALWTNGCTILGLRFAGSGSYEILVRVQVDERQLEVEETEASYALLALLFGRERFAAMRGILERISISEDDWLATARPLVDPNAQRQFIEESRDLLDKLATAALASIDRAEQDMGDARNDLDAIVQQLGQETERLLPRLPLSSSERPTTERDLRSLLNNPLAVDEARLEALRPRGLKAGAAQDWAEGVRRILGAVASYRERQQARQLSEQVHDSFQIWKERYRVIEGGSVSELQRRSAYAEQVGYAFFVRLLLARVLEDRRIIPRLISDGGLQRWRAVVDPQQQLTGGEPRIHGAALLEVLYEAVSVYYQHFFDQPVFDWFMPDDYLLALGLERLGTFQFDQINRDLLGYAYEAYVERAFRGEKGHFLTRGEIVDYILDQAGYDGRAVIGRRVLDPAVGSGSFLVHAARRSRQALEEAFRDTGRDRAELARTYVRFLQTNFVGFEINPFSCYLAELNLLLQALDDLVYLWTEVGERVAIDRFAIYNTNSLVLSPDVLNEEPQLEVEEPLRLDPAGEAKVGGAGSFDYVVMNPPYLNRGILTELPDLRAIPFYRSILGGGDVNHFHAFVRLANHFVAPGGRVSIIVPLNLYGDQSSGPLRRWLSAPLAGPAPEPLQSEFTLLSLTRFYSRRVLFDDVLQGVCVSTWERRATEAAEDYRIELAGGWSIEEARRNRSAFRAERVITTDPFARGLPVQDQWHNAWAVIPDERYLLLWEQIRDSCVRDLGQWTDGEIRFQQGDVNATRTRPLRPREDGGQVDHVRRPVATAGSRDFDSFGHYSPSGVLDADADVSAMRLSEQQRRDADRERVERVLRIASLTTAETVLALKDIVGIEPARPVLGALYERGAERQICFEHTVQVAFPLRPEHNAKAAATFALLVSSVSNFVLSLFSTNVHVTTNEIQRLPLPEIDDATVGLLAELAWTAQRAGEQYHGMRSDLGASVDSPSPARVLQLGETPTETLEEALLRGDLSLPTQARRHIGTLWEAGEVTVSGGDAVYRKAVGVLLAPLRGNYGELATQTVLPRRGSAAQFLRALERSTDQLRQAREDLYRAIAQIDRAVLALYGIEDPEHVTLIGAGMPWTSTAKEFADGILRHVTEIDVPRRGNGGSRARRTSAAPRSRGK